jgi:hypothetical protein
MEPAEHPGASTLPSQKDNMADNKYGEVYTEDEVVQMVTMAVQSVVDWCASGNGKIEELWQRFSEGNIREVARTDIERVFNPGEPLFILRGQDRRALGAVRWYRDHQWPNATKEHLDSIDEALAFFESYRKMAGTKEPD